MARKRKSGRLQVALNGRLVGRLTRDAAGATHFAYIGDWLDWEYAMPVSCSMPLAERVYTGMEVRAVFENLLPDNEAVLARLAIRVGAEGTDAFSMLAALGRDCAGALQFLHEGESLAPPGPPQGEALTLDEVTVLIRSLAVAPLGVRGGDGDAFRISLAGAQHKTALLRHDGTWMRPLGTTPTTHILKPQIGEMPWGHGLVDMTDSVQNEYFCMALCRALGLPVAKTDILQLADGTLALVIERFDRRLDGRGRLLRLPQEDICQALGVPPTRKYADAGGPDIGACLELLKSSDTPNAARRTFIKAQLVFWLIGATDGHAKNFSLFLHPQGGFSLAPLYDILSTQWQHDRRQIKRNDMRLAMPVGNKCRYRLDEIRPHRFEQTARRAGFPVGTLREVMAEMVEALPGAAHTVQIATEASVPDAMAEAILNAAARRAGQLGAYLGG